MIACKPVICAATASAPNIQYSEKYFDMDFEYRSGIALHRELSGIAKLFRERGTRPKPFPQKRVLKGPH